MESSIIFSIIGVITGSAGMIIGIIGIIHNRFLAVHNFFTSMEDQDFISARHYIYNRAEPFFVDDVDAARNAAMIINFFQHWGLLSRKHYLPIWVFDSGSGAGTIRLYELTKNFIIQMRKKITIQHMQMNLSGYMCFYLNVKTKSQKGVFRSHKVSKRAFLIAMSSISESTKNATRQ